MPTLRTKRILIINASSTPIAPAGFILLVDSDGSYLIDEDGAYLVEPI